MTDAATFEARARAALADYGMTDVTVEWLGPAAVSGKPMCNLFVRGLDDIDVARMVADDILKPLYADIAAYGAGKTFRHAAVSWEGGATFWCHLTNRAERARYALEQARIAVSMLDQAGDPIGADKLWDLSMVRYQAEMDAHRAEIGDAEFERQEMDRVLGDRA